MFLIITTSIVLISWVLKFRSYSICNTDGYIIGQTQHAHCTTDNVNGIFKNNFENRISPKNVRRVQIDIDRMVLMTVKLQLRPVKSKVNSLLKIVYQFQNSVFPTVFNCSYSSCHLNTSSLRNAWQTWIITFCGKNCTSC